MGRLSALHQTLTRVYTAEELKVLCFDLDVSHDALSGDALPARVASLLRHLDAHNRLPELVALASKEYPKQTWQVPAPRPATDPSATDADEDGLAAFVLRGGINNNSGNVVIGGKNVNVVQIGSLNIPRTVLFGLMGLVTVLGLTIGGLVWNGNRTSQEGQAKLDERLSTMQATATPGPSKMPTGPFNIAVAPFSQMAANGQLESSKDGLDLSGQLYQKLIGELPANDTWVWSDTLDQSIKGTTLGIITGTTAEARQKSAQQLADRVGAHMIIFGQLSGEGDDGKFEPEFYIATSATKFQGEADDVLGGHKLGTPIQVTRPMNLSADETLRMAETLKARAIFVKGVLLDLIGLHAKAYYEFRKIEGAWMSSEQSENSGREVLPTFTARQLVFSLDRPTLLTELKMTRAQALAESQKQVNIALAYNPDYGLAYLQQGNLALSRAELVINPALQQLIETGAITFTTEYTQAKSDVSSAIKAFDQFLKLAQGDAENVLAAKAHISLANAYRLEGMSLYIDNKLDDADKRFAQANQELDLTMPAHMQNKPRLLVTAQWVRGGIAFGQAYVRYSSGDDLGYSKFLKLAAQEFTACTQQLGDGDTTLNIFKQKCQKSLTAVLGGTP